MKLYRRTEITEEWYEDSQPEGIWCDNCGEVFEIGDDCWKHDSTMGSTIYCEECMHNERTNQ